MKVQNFYFNSSDDFILSLLKKNNLEIGISILNPRENIFWLLKNLNPYGVIGENVALFLMIIAKLA